jgi:hypothetical protein
LTLAVGFHPRSPDDTLVAALSSGIPAPFSQTIHKSLFKISMGAVNAQVGETPPDLLLDRHVIGDDPEPDPRDAAPTG